MKPRNICLPIIHTRINGVFLKKPTSGGRPFKDKRHKAKKRAKKDISCIILHNLECYQFWYIERIMQCE